MESLPVVAFEDLGRAPYREVWDYQTELRDALVARKRSNSKQHRAPCRHRLLFVEHDPVYTIGKSGKLDHLLLSEEELVRRGVSLYRSNRGGDITYHGPGQLVGYPIFDLDDFFHDVRRYIAALEEAVIRTLAIYNLEGRRYEGYTGVWLAPSGMLPWRKICAIGVHLSRWVTLHGFALNVDPDLAHFRGIVPCGITRGTHEVTSLALELGTCVDAPSLKVRLLTNMSEVFGFRYERSIDPSELSSWSSPAASPA